MTVWIGWTGMAGVASMESISEEPMVQLKCQRLFQHTRGARPRQSPKPIMKEIPL